MINYFTSKLASLFRRQFDRWLNRRMPAQARQTLSGKNIFILPSKFGFIFLVFVTLLFVLATNYQNNLILFFAYLLSSLFVSAMLHSFFNLKDLSIELSGDFQGYANDNIGIPITLISSKVHYGLTFNFNHQTQQHCQQTSLDGKSTKVVLPFFSAIRGAKSIDRLVITSEYSLGLFKCWTKLAFPVTVVVYPQALPFRSNLDANKSSPVIDENNKNNQAVKSQSNNDEFIQLVRYRTGESLSKVAWKQLAKGQGWLSKQYGALHNDLTYFSLQDMPAHDTESKLQMLCYLIQQSYQSGGTYGVILGNTTIEANNSKHHFQACLTALAMFGMDNDEINNKGSAKYKIAKNLSRGLNE